jgi:acyl-CoA reductase-like NAD-dependent aldehyde dehydrogenase
MQLERVMGLVEDAKKHGGKIEAGGVRLEGSGYFYPPTIVTERRRGRAPRRRGAVRHRAPDPQVLEGRRRDRAGERTHYGLGGSIWTSDLDSGTSSRRSSRAARRG